MGGLELRYLEHRLRNTTPESHRQYCVLKFNNVKSDTRVTTRWVNSRWRAVHTILLEPQPASPAARVRARDKKNDCTIFQNTLWKLITRRDRNTSYTYSFYSLSSFAFAYQRLKYIILLIWDSFESDAKLPAECDTRRENRIRNEEVVTAAPSYPTLIMPPRLTLTLIIISLNIP